MSGSDNTILIAEDNRAMAQVLRYNLERAGFSVTTVYDGEQAAIQVASHPFGLVITDLQMPVMNGAELCRYIREDLELTDLPIAICSAKGLEVDTADLVVRYGVAQVFFKPTSPNSVVEFARKVFASSTAAKPEMVGCH